MQGWRCAASFACLIQTPTYKSSALVAAMSHDSRIRCGTYLLTYLLTHLPTDLPAMSHDSRICSFLCASCSSRKTDGGHHCHAPRVQEATATAARRERT